MIVLFWNFQGLVLASTIRTLQAMLKQHNLDCLRIMEIKISSALGILSSLGFLDSIDVPATGLRGGMILAWRRDFDFYLVVQNQSLISIVVFGDPAFQPWVLSLIHAPCEPIAKDEFWEELGNVGMTFSSPLLILGDFNVVSNQQEKWGPSLLHQLTTSFS